MTTTRLSLKSAMLLTGVSAALASCGTTLQIPEAPRANFPTRLEDVLPGTESPEPTYAPSAPQPAAQNQPTAQPSAPVTSSRLPPAGAAQTPSPSRPPAYTSPAPTPAAPVGRPGEATSYQIQQGDTLSGVSRRFRVPVQALIDLNGLTPGGGVRAGQVLRLPPSAVDTGPDTRASGPAMRAPQTAYPPASTSPAPTPTRPSPGAPPLASDPVPPRLPPQQATQTAQPPRSQQPLTRPAPPPTAGQMIRTPAPPAESEIARLGRGRLQWPLRGEILTRFGQTGTAQRSDGINIGAPSGTPVLAAAAGEVAYAGDSVPGYGNLVLIKHTDGWVTAYALLGSYNVRIKDRVAQGQQIGVVGQGPGVTRPQLHFEVRYAASAAEKARPYDPLLVLP
jgi:murein DD-endopeptidase MepM/ murein hydrolase activator NlpD